MHIRPMTATEKPALLQILKNTPEFNSLDIKTAEEVVDNYLHDPDKSGYYTLVAERDTNILGFVAYGLNPLTLSTWDIYWIAVEKASRGMGIGKALIATVEQFIKDAEGTLIIIETSATPTYENTNRFYRLMGYNSICRIRDFYAPGDDKIIYEKRL